MIYVECYADETLVKVFNIPRRKIVHAHCKGSVCNKLEKTKNSIGLVDEDPKSAQPSYMSRLIIKSSNCSIKLLFDKRTNNHLIILCPGLEKWILNAAIEAKIDTDKYELPNDPKRLHAITGRTKIPDNFEKFLIAIKQSKMMKALEKLVTGADY